MQYNIAVPIKGEDTWYTELGLADVIKIFNECLYQGYDVFNDIRKHVPPYILARRILSTVGLRKYGAEKEVEDSRVFYHEYGTIIYKLYAEGESFDRVKNGGKNTKKLEYFLTFNADKNIRTMNDMLLYDNLSAPCMNKLEYASTPDSVMELISRLDDTFRLVNDPEYMADRSHWDRQVNTHVRRVNTFIYKFRLVTTLGLRITTSKGKLIKTRNAFYPELFVTACDIIKSKFEPVKEIILDMCNINSASRYLPDIGMDLYQPSLLEDNLKNTKHYMLSEATIQDSLITLKYWGKRDMPSFTIYRVHDDNPIDGMRTSNLSRRFVYWAEKMQRFI